MADKKAIDPQKRFSFGKNWGNFLTLLSEERILEAEKSLQEKLDISNLTDLSFLDIGSGSGLFSLAAYRLGARVFSFDYDQQSVQCALYLKKNYTNNSDLWQIDQGSVLDEKYLKNYDPVDILYSWGVLHHTGNMYLAFKNIIPLIKPGGKLFISIYNDQGSASKRWLWIKSKYNNGSYTTKTLLSLYTLIRQWTCTFTKDLLKTGNPLKTWLNYGNDRGMSPWYDVVDWAGGYPFEVAKPEEVFKFFKDNGFVLESMKTCAGGLGCNEFVFSRLPSNQIKTHKTI